VLAEVRMPDGWECPADAQQEAVSANFNL